MKNMFTISNSSFPFDLARGEKQEHEFISTDNYLAKKGSSSKKYLQYVMLSQPK